MGVLALSRTMKRDLTCRSDVAVNAIPKLQLFPLVVPRDLWRWVAAEPQSYCKWVGFHPVLNVLSVCLRELRRHCWNQTNKSALVKTVHAHKVGVM